MRVSCEFVCDPPVKAMTHKDMLFFRNDLMSHNAQHLIHGKTESIPLEDGCSIEGPVFIVESTHEQFYEKATRNLCPCEITLDGKARKISRFGGDVPYELMLITSYSKEDGMLKVRFEDWSSALFSKSRRCTYDLLEIFLESARYCNATDGLCGVFNDDRLDDVTLMFAHEHDTPGKLRGMLIEFVDDPAEGRWKECVSEVVNKYDARELYELFGKSAHKRWDEDGKAFIQLDDKMGTHRYRRIAESIVFSEFKKGSSHSKPIEARAKH